MSKIFAIFLISFAFSEEPLLEKCLYPTITISSNSGYGSAAIVKSIKIEEQEYINFFVSCSHIVTPNETFHAIVFKYENLSTIKETEKYPCLFYAFDKEKDVSIGAFLSKERLPIAEMNISPKLFVGTKVTSFGCGGADYPRLEEGKVTAPDMKTKFAYKVVRTNLHVIPGDSGGPVFKDCKLIGIINSIRQSRNFPVFSTSFFVPSTVFKDWNDEFGGAYDFCWEDSQTPRLLYHKLKFFKEYSRE